MYYGLRNFFSAQLNLMTCIAGKDCSHAVRVLGKGIDTGAAILHKNIGPMTMDFHRRFNPLRSIMRPMQAAKKQVHNEVERMTKRGRTTY
jgi:hypothetical protein